MGIDVDATVEEILVRLRAAGTPERAEAARRYAPSALEMLGVAVPDLRGIRKDLSRRLKPTPGAEVLALALALVRTGTFEGRQVGYEIVGAHRGCLAVLAEADVEALGAGMDNWASVDCFSLEVAGLAWRHGRILDDTIRRWAASPDRWWRRSALVSTIPLNMKSRGGTGDAARTVLVLDLLATDRDDLVGKAVSWALRELGERDRPAVEAFLATWEDRLPARVRREVRSKLDTGLKRQAP